MKETREERNIRKERIETPTKDQIESYLKRINWSLVDHGCEFYYFYDHKNTNRKWYLWHDRVELKEEYGLSCVFYLKDVALEMLDGKDAVAIVAKNNDSVFILFMNHNIKTLSLKD